MTADLEHGHHETFRAVWGNRAMHEELVEFEVGPGGAVAARKFVGRCGRSNW